jgi:hypothetical protein
MAKCKLCEVREAKPNSDDLCFDCQEIYDSALNFPVLTIRALRMASPPISAKTQAEGWIGVDLDGTLAHYDGWAGVDQIGAPIPLMVERVKAWLAEGKQVRIMTARVHPNQDGRVLTVVRYWIEKWCLEHIGQALLITHEKDFGMVELWDDRAVQVEKNTGQLVVDLARFSPMGDNHHNAAACPYCRGQMAGEEA